ERMNGQNVTMHALSLTVPMVHWAPPERGAQLAQLVNDAMAKAHTAFPDRFVGCATLPVQDPALALKELERVAGGRAIRGVYLPTNVGGRELSDPARSEEHTSELQSRFDLVCRLLLEKQ